MQLRINKNLVRNINVEYIGWYALIIIIGIGQSSANTLVYFLVTLTGFIALISYCIARKFYQLPFIIISVILITLFYSITATS